MSLFFVFYVIFLQLLNLLIFLVFRLIVFLLFFIFIYFYFFLLQNHIFLTLFYYYPVVSVMMVKICKFLKCGWLSSCLENHLSHLFCGFRWCFCMKIILYLPQAFFFLVFFCKPIPLKIFWKLFLLNVFAHFSSNGFSTFFQNFHLPAFSFAPFSGMKFSPLMYVCGLCVSSFSGNILLSKYWL